MPGKRELSQTGRALLPGGQGSFDSANASEFDKTTEKGTNLYATTGSAASASAALKLDEGNNGAGAGAGAPNSNGTPSILRKPSAAKGSVGNVEPLSMTELEPELNHLHERLERLEQVSSL